MFLCLYPYICTGIHPNEKFDSRLEFLPPKTAEGRIAILGVLTQDTHLHPYVRLSAPA